MTKDLVIWGDNVVEATWFRDLTPLLSGAEVALIGSRTANPPQINDLLVYDRPDIILAQDGRPVMVLEKTREVPTGHNIGQRMARLVRAAEGRLPTIMFLPFDARKHGTYASLCHLNIRLLRALLRMTEIHDAPVIAVNWPARTNGELVVDGPENAAVAKLVESFVAANMPRWWPAAQDALAEMEEEYRLRLQIRGLYGNHPGSVETMTTEEFLRRSRHLAGSAALAPLSNRESTLVYQIGMTPANCRREDPYTGMQFVYDYTDCRSGPRVDEKGSNLVLQFPLIPRGVWMASNPNDLTRKSSNWYVTANAMLFADGVELLRQSRP